MMDPYELAKQHREDMLREVKRNRLARVLWANCKRHAGRASALMWDLERIAGRLLKLLRRTLRNAGY